MLFFHFHFPTSQLDAKQGNMIIRLESRCTEYQNLKMCSETLSSLVAARDFVGYEILFIHVLCTFVLFIQAIQAVFSFRDRYGIVTPRFSLH